MILLTGSSGFIGKVIAEALRKKQKVRCIVRNRSQGVPGKNLEFVEGSIADKKVLEKAMRGIKIVIHAAASIDAKDQNIQEINVKATELLVQAARKEKVRQFIFISSENVLYDGKDAYTESKRSAEKIVRQFPNHLILREPVVYGPGDKRYMGKLMALIEKLPMIPIPGNGQWKFQPIFVEDIPRYIEQGIKKKIRGTYLVAGAEAIAFKALIKKILEMTGIKKPITHLPMIVVRWISRVMELCGIKPPLSTAQLKNMSINREYNIQEQVKVFGIRPTSLQEGLRRTLQERVTP